jgi:hypothetical protein
VVKEVHGSHWDVATRGQPRRARVVHGQPHVHICAMTQLVEAAKVGDTAEVFRLVAAGADMRFGCCARAPVPGVDMTEASKRGDCFCFCPHTSEISTLLFSTARSCQPQ